MMRFLTKIQRLNPISQHLGFFNFSTHSKYKKNHSNPYKTQKSFHNKHVNSKRDAIDSLFSDITEILGTENIFLGSVLSTNDVCTLGVRRNAQEKNDCESGEMYDMGDTQLENLAGNDVSDVVERIVEVVKGDHGGISMEERLDKSGFKMSVEIVGKVLKKCLRVPHLGTRFFNWVKLNNVSCVTTENYNGMLYLAGNVKDFVLVERLMEEMLEYNCEKDIKTWTIVLMHYGKAKLAGKALSKFEKMRKSGIEPDVDAYRILIQLLCQFRKGEIALEFYKEMVQKGFVLDSKLYRHLLNCVAGCGDVDGVYLVVNDMINVCHIPEHDAYSSVLKSFCITGRIKEALELIRDLNKRNVTLSPLFFETLVKGLCKADMIDDALEIVDIMKKRNVVNEVVYAALINGYLRKKDASKAFDLFHCMKDAGFTPLTSSYTELMQQHFNSSEYEKGCALYNELLETGVKLDLVAYTAMIAGHGRYGHIADAWKVFHSMVEEGIIPNQKCFLIFIKELCKSSSSANEIVKVLIFMRDSRKNIGKDISDCVISYMERKKDNANLELVKEILKPGRNWRIVEASQGMIQSGRSNSVESNAADCLLLEPLPPAFDDEHLHYIRAILSSKMDWFRMQEALEKLTIPYTPVLVSEILHVCGQYGTVVLHFFSWVRKQPDYRHTAETYNLAIKIAGKGKDFKYMRNLFQEMQRNGCLATPDTWTIMIMLYGRVGLTDTASRMFIEMKANGCKPTITTYKYLIMSFCGRKGRKVDEAIKLFAEMINAGFIPDKVLVGVCFDCFCQAGKLAEAKTCLEHLQKTGFSTPLSYSLLIRALCRRGQLEEAITLADEVKDGRYISESLIHGFLKKGQLDEAMSKINSMKEAGIQPTAYVYTSIISHLCKAKDIDKALDIFQSMWAEGSHPTVVTYTELILGYINTGNLRDAQTLFLRMRFKGPFLDFKAYSSIIARLCESGKSEVGMQFLSEMLNDGIVPSTINFQTVFFGLNREGKHHLTETVMHLKRDVARKRKFLTA